MSLSLLILILIYGSVNSLINFCPNNPNVTSGAPRGDGDPGDPLFLTPYVENGCINLARQLARVPSDQWLGVESYAGFFTVDKDHDSNFFFWYFPSMTNPKDAPVILWLNMGLVEGSDLMGVFLENGPIISNYAYLEKREITWANSHHMIYVDCPCGTGFSFTNATNTNEEQIGAHLYSAMTQFFLLFPELQTNAFYVVGKSYGGKFATALAYTIYKNSSQPSKLKSNFKGLVIDNGWIDPKHQIWSDKYLNELGILDDNQANILRKLIKRVEQFIDEENWMEAYYALEDEYQQILHFTGLHSINLLNYLYTDQDFRDIKNKRGIELLTIPAIRKSIHVGNLPFFPGMNYEIYSNFKENIPKSVAPWLHELYDANYCDIIIYNGQLSIFETYPATKSYISKMNLTGCADAKKGVLMIGNDVVGYTTQCHRLTQIMLRNAGTLVSRDQPYWVWAMIIYFTYENSFFKDTKITLKDRKMGDYENWKLDGKW